MQQNEIAGRRSSAYGDQAVDGLFAGAGAGALMAVALALLALVSGEAVQTMLGRFDPGQEGNVALGLLSHAAVSAIYGALFTVGHAWLARRVPALERWLPVAGLAYGLLIWLAAEWVFLPAAGSPLLDMPAWQFGLAHAVYGLVLGELVRRQR